MKKRLQKQALIIAIILPVVLSLAGCQTMQGALNQTKVMIGAAQKRDIMVSEVQNARVSLEEVKAQFQMSMEQFKTVLLNSQAKAEEKHKALKSETKTTSKKAEDIQDSIDSVSKAAEAMFVEWETELNQYSSENLRSSSAMSLQEVKDQNAKFINAMTLANEKAAPVITAFNDLVLFSKNSLTDQVMDSLQSELASVEESVAGAVMELDNSISEADTLINLMGSNEVAAE